MEKIAACGSSSVNTPVELPGCDLVGCFLQLKLVGIDAKCRGNFLPCRLAGLGDSLLLGESRLRNAHALGNFILRKVQVFAPGANREAPSTMRLTTSWGIK